MLFFRVLIHLGYLFIYILHILLLFICLQRLQYVLSYINVYNKLLKDILQYVYS